MAQINQIPLSPLQKLHANTKWPLSPHRRYAIKILVLIGRIEAITIFNIRWNVTTGFYANFDFQRVFVSINNGPSQAGQENSTWLNQTGCTAPFPSPPSFPHPFGTAANRLGAKCIHSSLAAQVLGLKSATIDAQQKKKEKNYIYRSPLSDYIGMSLINEK